ncbi:MAG: hypothetical protein J6A79_05865 [Clostridia bacterium]|nr:hypothetical protein [Clostridia bacterium]
MIHGPAFLSPARLFFLSNKTLPWIFAHFNKNNHRQHIFNHLGGWHVKKPDRSMADPRFFSRCSKEHPRQLFIAPNLLSSSSTISAKETSQAIAIGF